MIPKSLLLMLPGCLLAGFAVYVVFSYLLVPLRITLPLSFTMGILIFGLTKYYSSKPNEIESTDYGSNTSSRISLTQIILIAFFIIALLIVTVFPYNIDSRLFTDWQNVDALHIIRILSAIGICFFLPGYVIVVILERETRLTAPLKFLLAYSFSILIAGLIGYVGASLGYELSDRRILISSTSVALLVLFLVHTLKRSDGGISNANPDHFYKALLLTWNKIRRKNSQIIIIGSLFMLVIISTYYLNNGKIVVDQWFYHGRAILMNTAAYRDLSTAETYIDPYESKTSDVNQINPPFFSALLSAFFNLSGTPSVNSYVSINFLNIIPLIAFYYFVVSWIQHRNQRAVMLALSFFMLSSGFGWIYALYDSTLTDPMTSTRESIDLLSKTTDATYDVGLPTTFLNVGHPDITTPFIIVALSIGFTLLGLLGDTHSICGCVYKNTKNLGNIWSKIKTRNISLILCFIIITVLTFLGILAHDEFYLFVIIGSTLMLFRKPNIKSSNSVFYAAFLSAIILVILVDISISPTNYYTQREIFSVPLIFLCFIYVTASWILYLAIRAITSSTNLHITNTTKKIRHIIPQRVTNVVGLVLKDDHDRRKLSTLLKIAIASTVVYLYLFTFFVWTQVSVQDTLYYVKDQWNVPSYLLPVKFGLVGILALALVISHIFKKFEKDIFIFGMIALIAFVAGPYYDEHRFGKYVMASLDVLAAILIYRIISSSFLTTKLRLKPLLTGLMLGSVIIGSGLSVLMFAGYVELLSTRPDYLEGGRRDFPTEQEFKLLNFLQDRMVNSKIYNIAVPEKEVDVNRGLVTKIYGFTGIPRLKLIQSPLTLNSSTLEGLYASLVNTDTSYIVLPKAEFIHKFGQENLSSSSLSNNIIQFVIDTFPKVYQDSNYIVLKVPPLSPPVEESSNVGLVYQKDSSLPFSEPQFDNFTLSSTYSRYYYPLSILALSNITYDTFVDDDYTLFSKEVVVLPYDPFPHDGNNLSRYLDYVKSGGKLIVINSDTSNLQGSFAKLLSIELGSQRNFNAILPASESDSMHLIKKNNLNISGVAQNIILNSTSNDTRIQSYYAYSTNDGKYQNMVAPFSIEKTYGNGKIIFVNAVGYFDAIFKYSSSKKINSNDSYFTSLGKVLALMNLEFGDQYRGKVASYQITSAPATRIVGDLKLAANETVLFNSSSLSFPHSESRNKIYSYDLAVKQLSILNSSKISYLNKVSNGTPGLSSNNTSLSYSSGKTDSTVDNGIQFNNENITIRNLKLYGGPFEINIISTKNKIPIEIPTSSSHHDYIGVSIPTGFDIKIKFPPDNSTYVEFDATNTGNKKQTYETFRISGTDIGTNASSENSSGSNEIHLRDIRADLGAIKSISVLMKSPEITLLKRQQPSNHALSSSGNISVSFNEDSHKGSPVEIKNNVGNITARIAYSDFYNSNNKSGTRTQFVTYLDEDFKVISGDSNIHTPAGLTGEEKKMQLPGDISEVAKKRGMHLPWLKELGSNSSIILGVLVMVIAIGLSRLLLVNSDKQPSNR